MLERIYTWGTLGVAFISTAISLIVFIKKSKGTRTSKEQAEEIEKLEKVNKLAKILQTIPELIIKAEKTFPSAGELKFGAAKLTWVLGEIEKLCLKEDIEYLEEEFKFEIEKILETPKKGENKNENANS